LDKWGLALSGGGILGAAHLGVVAALEDMGLRPPVLAGTSAGGLVAGILALGVPIADLTAVGTRVAAHPFRYFRPTVVGLIEELLGHGPAATGLLDPAEFLGALLSLAPGAATTADWDRPTAITSVDLVSLRPVGFPSQPVQPPADGDWEVILGAPLRLALGATMAEPALYTTADDATHVFVDGGLADTLPEDWAVAMGAERVIAVQVSPARPAPGTRMGLTTVIERSIAFVTHDADRLRRPTRPVLRIEPDTEGVPLFGFSHFGQLVAAGAAAVRARQAEIRRFLDDA
jgi:NTE family protein